MPQINRVKIAAMVVALGAGVATAHETDQWTVPPNGDPLVDIGGYLNQFFVQRLEGALEQTNLQISENFTFGFNFWNLKCKKNKHWLEYHQRRCVDTPTRTGGSRRC